MLSIGCDGSSERCAVCYASDHRTVRMSAKITTLATSSTQVSSCNDLQHPANLETAVSRRRGEPPGKAAVACNISDAKRRRARRGFVRSIRGGRGSTGSVGAPRPSASRRPALPRPVRATTRKGPRPKPRPPRTDRRCTGLLAARWPGPAC